jgi:transcriptional regulator with XRE-family HTH domain
LARKKIQEISIHGVSIAALLRDRRKKMGMTLQELAGLSGMSASFISQAERGKAIPSIVSLISLAKPLKVGLDYFFNVPKDTTILRRGDDPEYIKIQSPVTYIRLSSGLPDEKMDAILHVIPPGLVFPRVHREGEAFYYLLEGELHFEIGDDTFDLRPTDSLHFNTQLEYKMQNRGDKPVKLLWVGTPPLFMQEAADKTIPAKKTGHEDKR